MPSPSNYADLVRRHILGIHDDDASAPVKEELRFWRSWTVIEAELDVSANSEVLRRCGQLWLAERDGPYRTFIESGVSRHLKSWRDQEDRLPACWASRVFPEVYRRIAKTDPIVELDRRGVRLAARTRSDMMAAPDLTMDVRRLWLAPLRESLEEWTSLWEMLDPFGIPRSGFKCREALAGAMEALTDVEAAVCRVEQLVDEDFRDADAGVQVETCRLTLLRLDERLGPHAGFARLRTLLARIYEACKVRGLWEEFIEVARKAWRPRPGAANVSSDSSGKAVESLDRIAEQIQAIFSVSGMERSRCADLCAEQARSEFEEGPLDLAVADTKWAAVTAGIAAYLDEVQASPEAHCFD